MKTAKTFTTTASLLATLVVGCAEPIPPKNPTWEADVYPIVQGQCLHCHGGEAADKGNGFRFDFRDGFTDVDKCGDLGFNNPPVFMAVGNWKGAIEPQDPSPRATMPPAPASLLEDWQIQTLKNYAKFYASSATNKKNSHGKRSDAVNRKPKILITSKLPDKVGEELKVSYRFEDTDGDPVIGVLRLGDAKVDLLKFSGEVTIPGITGTSGDTLTLTADICDGWDKVTDEDLGKVERE